MSDGILRSLRRRCSDTERDQFEAKRSAMLRIAAKVNLEKAEVRHSTVAPSATEGLKMDMVLAQGVQGGRKAPPASASSVATARARRRFCGRWWASSL